MASELDRAEKWIKSLDQLRRASNKIEMACWLLGVENEAYETLHGKIKNDLASLGVLGDSFDTNMALVRDVARDVLKALPPSIPEACRLRFLLLVVERCNEEHMGESPSQLSAPGRGTSANSARTNPRVHTQTDDLTFIPLQRLHKILIVVRDSVGQRTTVCRPTELLPEQLGLSVSVRDMSFSKFMQILKDDLGFREGFDLLTYTFGEDTVRFRDMRSWVNALMEIRNLKSDRLIFSIMRGVPASKSPAEHESQKRKSNVAESLGIGAASTSHSSLSHVPKRQRLTGSDDRNAENLHSSPEDGVASASNAIVTRRNRPRNNLKAEPSV